MFTNTSGYYGIPICMCLVVEENIKGMTHGDGTDVLSQNFDNQVLFCLCHNKYCKLTTYFYFHTKVMIK